MCRRITEWSIHTERGREGGRENLQSDFISSFQPHSISLSLRSSFNRSFSPLSINYNNPMKSQVHIRKKVAKLMNCSLQVPIQRLNLFYFSNSATWFKQNFMKLWLYRTLMLMISWRVGSRSCSSSSASGVGGRLIEDLLNSYTEN